MTLKGTLILINNSNIYLYGPGLIFIDKNIENSVQKDIIKELEENEYIGVQPYDIERILSEKFGLIKIQAGSAFISFMERESERITIKK
jgi:hypothetical protein